MRLHRNRLAVATAVFALAGGGGVAWACNPGGSQGGYPGATTGTTTAPTTSTPASTTTAPSATTAGNSASRSANGASAARRHSRRSNSRRG